MTDVLTVLLAGRECPFACLMCDLWSHTLDRSAPVGALALQVQSSVVWGGERPRSIKLYNAGSFFDRQAVPEAEHELLLPLIERFERVVVESHPALIGSAAYRFAERLAGRLEVAMGLETVHPVVLPRLNKRMDLDLFHRAASGLVSNGIPFRAFVLLGLPWVSRAESVAWAVRSVEYALDQGAERVVIVPTRSGNGALDLLASGGAFLPPTLSDLEEALDRALPLAGQGGIVMADTWDVTRFDCCPECRQARIDRLVQIGLEQRPIERLTCPGGLHQPDGNE